MLDARRDTFRLAYLLAAYLTDEAPNCHLPTYLLTYTYSLTHTCFLACSLTSDPSQGSRGHVNPKGPKAVISTFVQRGYEHDRNATRMLRKCAKHPNFRNCILVFRHRWRLSAPVRCSFGAPWLGRVSYLLRPFHSRPRGSAPPLRVLAQVALLPPSNSSRRLAPLATARTALAGAARSEVRHFSQERLLRAVRNGG